jgi:hypothetical protein
MLSAVATQRRSLRHCFDLLKKRPIVLDRGRREPFSARRPVPALGLSFPQASCERRRPVRGLLSVPNTRLREPKGCAVGSALIVANDALASRSFMGAGNPLGRLRSPARRVCMPVAIAVLDLTSARIVQVDQMTRSDGDLAVTAGDVEHVGGLAQAGMSRPQRPHESLTSRNACA